jgi:hypothetical protein
MPSREPPLPRPPCYRLRLRARRRRKESRHAAKPRRSPSSNDLLHGWKKRPALQQQRSHGFCVIRRPRYSGRNFRAEEIDLSSEYKGHDDSTKKLIVDSVADHSYGSIQLILVPASLNIARADSQATLLQHPPEQLGKHGFGLAACIARPVSVGNIHITSSDAQVDPAIDPAYLTHPADIEMFSEKWCLLRLSRTKLSGDIIRSSWI